MICHSPAGLLLFLLGQADSRCTELMSGPAGPTDVSVLRYAAAFATTCVVEAPLYLWAIKGDARRRVSAVLLLNLATHPVVYFLFPFLFWKVSVVYGHMLLAAETAAILVEGLLLKKVWGIPLGTAMAISAAANLLSWGIGTWL